jgi:hypothetical protein
MIATGLAVACVSPQCAASSFTERLAADQQSAQGRVPAAATKAQPENKPRGGEVQAAPAQEEPRAAATEQVETKPPQVTYQDGGLTIIAENASLSEVLAAVREAMGADIDLPAGAAGQRIWVRLGPGPARTVLRDLLDGTEYNYIIQASEQDSDGIRSVLLTVRSKSAESGIAGAQMARGQNRKGQAVNASPAETSEPETAAATDTSPATVAPAPAVAAAADAASAPPETPPASPGVQSAASNLPITPGSAHPGASTPVGGSSEQMMQQLQSMYEQRRQLQIQQNQGQKPQAVN